MKSVKSASFFQLTIFNIFNEFDVISKYIPFLQPRVHIYIAVPFKYRVLGELLQADWCRDPVLVVGVVLTVTDYTQENQDQDHSTAC